MPVFVSIQRRGLIAAVIAGAALAAAVPASAHVIPLQELRQGVAMTPAQCASLPSTVWLVVQGRPFCIRYYLSNAGGQGAQQGTQLAARPVVFLEGDKLGSFNTRTGVFKVEPGKDRDINTDNLDRYAEGLSKRNKTTAIYLGRVGVDGSSGDHRLRHTLLELQVTNAALDAIKQRHRFEGFHLVGQSGGSTLAGGLLAMRADVGCAVLGAGRLVNPPNLWPKGPTGQIIEQFNVVDAAAIIAQRRTTRILLVTDPADQRVPEKFQTPFVQMVRQAGGQADQFLVQATDENRHGVTPYAHMTMAACVQGASSPEIAQQLTQLVAKRLADKAKADLQKATQQASAAPSAPSVPQPAQSTTAVITGPPRSGVTR
ncbi:hypothetical protein [Leptospira sp. severe_002]|uniref:hypothetical protein n=1 Tax=Leptospira sp. severe_002 TaxID=2838237 RepID=UPI001E483402|nr:hypothetical protein [Leptospira sp. severe_002]